MFFSKEIKLLTITDTALIVDEIVNNMENQHEKLQYELSNAKREFAKRSSKVVNISDRLK